MIQVTLKHSVVRAAILELGARAAESGETLTGEGYAYAMRVVRTVVRDALQNAHPNDGVEVRYDDATSEAQPGEQEIRSIDAPGHDEDRLEVIIRDAYARALDMGMWDNSDFERAD